MPTQFSNITQSERLEVIDWLVSHNYPALPVAPAQDARKYHKIVQTNPEQELWQHCPLTENLQPIPLYTGKNPSYIDRGGKPHLVNHRKYQKQLPTSKERRDWFANPVNGIGTLGGWNNTIWLDFDVKQFSSQQECDTVVRQILEQPELQNTFIERSHSGGWRIGIKVRQKPNFTNFAFSPGSSHIGEALGEGRFTVLAPTIGPSGNPYQSLNRTVPVEVESLESIGIFTTKTAKETHLHQEGVSPLPSLSVIPGSIPLEMLGHDTSREILNGANPTGDRSEALATAIQEWYGWENWTYKNGIAVNGNTETLAHYAGTQLSIDSERIGRILKGINPSECHPAAYYKGGDDSCWKKIRRLDKATFEAKCPTPLKEALAQEWSRNHNTDNGSSGGGRRPGGGSNNGSDGSDGGDDDGKNKIITHPAFIPVTPSELRAKINDLIAQGLPDSEISLAIPALAKRANYSELGTWKIYNDRLREIEVEENREETKAQVEALLKAKEASVNLHSVFPLALADALTKYAHWLNVRPEVVLLTVLTTVSGLHHTQTTSLLNRDWGFEVKPNLYTAIVAPPSQKKSPILKALAKKPLRVLEQKAREEAKKAYQQYKDTEQYYNSLSKEARAAKFPNSLPPTPPNRRKVYAFSDATTEGIRNQVEAYPNQGLIGLPDELARLIKSANKYRGGRGSDEEDLLSYYDGGGETILRADGLAGDFDNLLLAILGSIQPGVLQKLLKDCQDENGKWARFIFVNQPSTASVMSTDSGSFDLTPMLSDLYSKVNKLLPQEYKPESDAFTYYCGIYNEFEQRRVNESHPGLSAAWGKAEGRVGKIAVNLHVIHELMVGHTPSEFIPKARYQEAFRIVMFGMQQVFSLYNELGESEALATNLVKVIDVSQKKGWIVARDVQRTYDKASCPTPDQVRSWFRELEAMGKGSTSGNGRNLKYNYSVNPDKHKFVSESQCLVSEALTNESIDLTGIEPNVSNVSESQWFSEKKLSRIESDGDTPIEQLSGKDNFSENSLTTLTLLTNGSSPVDLGNSVVSELLTKPLTKPLTNEKQEEVIQAGSTANAQAEAELTTPSPVEVPVETTDTGAIDVSLSSSKADNLAVLEVSIPTPADFINSPVTEEQVQIVFNPGDTVSIVVGELVSQQGRVRRSYSGMAQVQLGKTWENFFHTELRLVEACNLKVGDRAIWDNAPAHCASITQWWEITAIDGEYAKLDLFSKPVLLAELRLAT